MKRLFAAMVVAVTLSSGVVTTAQADNRDRNRNEHRNDRHDDRRDNRNYDRHDDRRHDYRSDDWRRYDHRDDRRYDRRDWDRYYGFRHHDGRRYDYGRYWRPSGYSYRSWHYGDRLPHGYYSSRYVVNDYHVYRLRPPPYGYHYVRVDHDVVLAAIASGIVVSAVFGIFN